MSARELALIDILDECPALHVRRVLNGFLAGRYIGASILLRKADGTSELVAVGDMPDLWGMRPPQT